MPADAIRSLIDILPVAACAHRHGVVVHANEAFATALGFPDVSAAIGHAVDGQAPAETRWRRKDGTALIMRSAAAPITIDAEDAVVEIEADATNRAALHARLAASDRLASLGTLAAGVAHEINNPLTYVLGNLDYIRDQMRTLVNTPAATLAELDQVAAEAKSGAERVAQIVRGLRVFSRVDDEKRVPVDLAAVIEASLKMTGNEIRHRAKVVKTYRPMPMVVADDARLTQVFLNLFVNAAQAIREGHANENEIRVSTSTDDSGAAVVEIQDTGEGIAPEHLSRVFEPFFTTKPQGAGTGLGLAICHGIIEALGGTISVVSEVGGGTTFRVVLPGIEGAPPDVESSRRITTGQGRSGRILVIDDDARICVAVRRALGPNHDVVTTTSGAEAVALVKGGMRFDLILCDLMMPVLTGMDVYDLLTRVAPDQAERTVFLTGGAFTPSARAFLDQVPNERLDKPFDAARLRLLAKERVDATPRPALGT